MQVKKVKFYELKKKYANEKKMRTEKRCELKKVASFFIKKSKKGR